MTLTVSSSLENGRYAKKWHLRARLHLFFAATWREMPVISRQIGLRHDRTSFRQKNSKKKWRRPTHGFLHLNLKSLVRQAHERSSKLMSFRLGFFQGEQSGPLHDEKLPNSYTPVAFPSVLKHLSSDTVKGCSSSS